MKAKNKRERQIRRIRNRNRVNALRKQVVVFEPVFIIVLIKLGLNKKTPVAIKEQMTKIISMLSGNANFPSTSPPIAVLTTKRDELSALIVAASNGDRLLIEQRNIKQAQCEELLRLLSYDIQHQSQGDADKIHSAGFETRHAKSPSQLPGQVLGLKAGLTGYSGEIKLRWKAEKGRSGPQNRNVGNNKVYFKMTTLIHII